MNKIRMMLCLFLCIILIGGCGKDPESITDEELDEAIHKYHVELEKDALESFKVIGRDRTCQYFEEKFNGMETSIKYV